MVGIAVINAAVSKAGPLEDEVFKLDIRYTLDAFQHGIAALLQVVRLIPCTTYSLILVLKPTCIHVLSFFLNA